MTEPTLEEFLAVRADGDAVRMAFPRAVHGAFGGAFGGLIAAGAILSGRAIAPGRVPSGIDCRFVRGLRAGDARFSSTVVHAGRSLTVVRVDVHDADDRLATAATVSYVEPAMLQPLDVTPAPAELPDKWHDWVLPPGTDAPIVDLLRPRRGALGGGAIATAIRRPWQDPDGAFSAEAACIAADLCVGPPVGAAGPAFAHPNPDLAVRFLQHGVTDGDIVGVGRLLGAAGGLAVVDIEVHSRGVTFAAGVATSMVLRPARTNPGQPRTG